MNVYLKSCPYKLWAEKIYLLRQQTIQCADSALRFPYPSHCAVAFRWKTIHYKHTY